MNRSIFSASPFRTSYGLHPVVARPVMASSGFRAVGPILGQDILKDWGVEDIASDLTGFLSDMDGYIAKLPVGVAGPFQKRRDDCMKESILKKYPCLWDLFQDVKKALRGEYEEPKPPTPGPQPSPQPSGGGLPILPIAIGGVAVAAILYALLRGR